MAALSNDTVRRLEQIRGGSFRIKNAATVYTGGVIAIDRTTGDAKPSAAASGEFIVGISNETPFLGSTTPTAGTAGVLGATGANIPPRVPIGFEGCILEHATVTGVASAADLWKTVYASTDNDFTLTRPALGQPIGVVSFWHTSTECDILFFSTQVLAAMGLTGTGRETITLGSINCIIGTNAGVVDVFGVSATPTGYKAQFHGKIISAFTVCDTVPVGVGGTAALNPTINGVAVTGGICTVSTAGTTPIGLEQDGTGVTAANEFHEGDKIGIISNSSTQMTAGRVNFFLVVERLPGV